MKNLKMMKVIKYLKGERMNNFKEYGFKADFEGAILSDIEDYYIGYYVESYPCIKEKQKIPTFWNKVTGNCYKGAGVSNSKFSLKPIKKEWYENPDNLDTSKNNGGKTDCYQLENAPFKINDFDDFAEWRGLNGNQFNMGEVMWAFNVSRHSGTNYERELNKIIHYANREKLRISREFKKDSK